MALEQHVYRCDARRRGTLSTRLKITDEYPSLELLVDPLRLGEEINISSLLTSSDTKNLETILGISEQFSARAIGVIMPKMAIPIQEESEIVGATFGNMRLQKYPLKIDRDNRFVMPNLNLGNGVATFQDLKTLNIRGQITDVLAIALISPIGDKKTKS